jgi:hypothetical protein
MFSLRAAWRRLFHLYNSNDVPRKDAKEAFVEVLATIGVQESEACEGLRLVLDPGLTSEHGDFHNRTWPVICPNVLFVMQTAAPMVLGTNSVASKNFYHNVMQSTTVYLHELAARRSSNPMTRDTLRSLEKEYYETKSRDVLLDALQIKMGAKESTILVDYIGFTTRQNQPDTHICVDLSQAVYVETRQIVGPQTNSAGFTRVENELCALLHRPAATVSFVDYLWPLRLGFTINEMCIKTRVVQGKQQSYIAPVVEYDPYAHFDQSVPVLPDFFSSAMYSELDCAQSSSFNKLFGVHKANFH